MQDVVLRTRDVRKEFGNRDGALVDQTVLAEVAA